MTQRKVRKYPEVIVREDGTVMGSRGTVLKGCINMDGYRTVKVKRKHVRLHRLVAQKFIPNPLGLPEVNHKDGDKLNNNVSNLEWVTHRENLHHAMDNGRHNWGRTAVIGTHPDGTRSRYDSQTDAAKYTGTHQANINKCLKGQRALTGGIAWSIA